EVETKRLALQAHASQLEKRVEERTAALVRANRAKDEFLALVSHELRNPVTVIVGNAEVLHKRMDVMERRERDHSLADLRSEARRLQRITENLLILSQLEVGQVAGGEPILISRIIAARVEDHLQAFPNRDLRVDVPVPGPIVSASETHLELVLKN